jgi:hypothetical protein
MTPWQEHQARLRGHEIAALRHRWGETYKVSCPNGAFRAERLDGLGSLEAATAAGLQDMILDDYAERPVLLERGIDG